MSLIKANYVKYTLTLKLLLCCAGIDINEARRGEELKMLEDAQRWLDNGRCEEKADPRTGATALHVAACKGYIKVLT